MSQNPTSPTNRKILDSGKKFKAEFIRPNYKGSGKLEGKIALVTGGDSGIGKSVAIHFAREGADLALSFLASEQADAEETKKIIEKEGRKCLLLPGDLQDKDYCNSIVEQTVKQYGKLNILVNNAGIQFPSQAFADIDDEHLEKTFDVNILSFFRVTRAALKYLKAGDSIINTTSVTSYRGQPDLVDYSSTKGAINALTRSLSAQLAKKNIRVNAVAPGPICTPLIEQSFPTQEELEQFGVDAPLGRPGQPSECGPSYVFLACQDSSYMTGQCLHPNGGFVVNT